MDRHICKNCGKPFNYCRGCYIKPIPYKGAGFCSKECSAEFKANQKIEEVIPAKDVEVVINKEDISTSEEEVVEYPYFFTVDNSKEENDVNEDESNNGEEL